MKFWSNVFLQSEPLEIVSEIRKEDLQAGLVYVVEDRHGELYYGKVTSPRNRLFFIGHLQQQEIPDGAFVVQVKVHSSLLEKLLSQLNLVLSWFSLGFSSIHSFFSFCAECPHGFGAWLRLKTSYVHSFISTN